jgi:hypothetical protein
VIHRKIQLHLAVFRIDRVGTDDEDYIVGVNDGVFELAPPNFGGLQILGIEPASELSFGEMLNDAFNEVAIFSGIGNEHVMHVRLFIMGTASL